MYAYYHEEGCRGVAFYLIEIPLLGSTVHAKNAYMPGEQILNGDIIRCFACNEILKHLSIENIREVANADEPR